MPVKVGILKLTERRRRRWSEDEKRKICAEARQDSATVAEIARRHNVNPNQIFNWLRDPRNDEGVHSNENIENSYYPTRESFEPTKLSKGTSRSSKSDDGKLEFELANGHRLRIIGPYDPEALVRLIRGLSK